MRRNVGLVSRAMRSSGMAQLGLPGARKLCGGPTGKGLPGGMADHENPC